MGELMRGWSTALSGSSNGERVKYWQDRGAQDQCMGENTDKNVEKSISECVEQR